jgi:hypothetical protein
MIRFWRDVPAVTNRLRSAFRPMYSVGVGEWPLRFQATFSIWQNAVEMEKFAYKDKAHLDMVSKTRAVGWYKEELFARFHIVNSTGDRIVNFDCQGI